MSSVGDVDVIPESLMNAAGAISGSGPAYVSIDILTKKIFVTIIFKKCETF